MKINRKRKPKMEIAYLALYPRVFEIATFIYKSHLFSLDL